MKIEGKEEDRPLINLKRSEIMTVLGRFEHVNGKIILVGKMKSSTFARRLYPT